MALASEPVKIVRGEGIWLFEENGNRLLDGISSWWVNIHGHSRIEIAEAIYQQSLQLEQVIFAGFTHEPALRLADTLLDSLNLPDWKVFYSDNGSTAVEVGLKMAIQFFSNAGEPRNKILCWENCFHGETFGAMSVSDQPIFNDAFGKFLFATKKIPIPEVANLGIFEQELEALLSTRQFAAFIYEPLVQGTGGMNMYEPIILESIVKLCRQYGTLCIADEVMTGFFRTGTILAHHQCSILPDIICLAKGLTGGFLPLATTLCKPEVFNAFYLPDKKKTLFHGHSYTANPLGCAAAYASIQLFNRPIFQQQISLIKSKFENQRIRINALNPTLNARSTGCIFALNLHHPKSDYFSKSGEEAAAFFSKNHILIRPLGNVLYFMPPYVIKSEEIDHFFIILDLWLTKNGFFD